jgi:hypothetical protein
MKDEHGKKLRRSFGETEIDAWLLGGLQKVEYLEEKNT